MLEKPYLQDEKIVTCLWDEYRIPIEQVTFLPLGADFNAAVYHLVATDETAYFFKLKKGHFDEASVTLPKFLSDQGISQIIPPLPTQSGQLWGHLDNFKTILYPFVEGRNGYEIPMSERHWAEFGLALKKIHAVDIPPEIIGRIRRETYAAEGQQTVKMFLERVETDDFDDPVAKETAVFMKSKHTAIVDLIDRAEQRARILQANPPEFIVCHSDLHAGNILIGIDNGFYIVDWDEPILAPKERDLMYIGSGLLASKRTPEEEETLFYSSYGQVPINLTALAYYRYERIIQDIFEFCKQLLLTNEGGADREISLGHLKSNFLPNRTIDIAYQADEEQL